MYSVVTAGITFAMLFLGGVCDKIGVPKTLALSFSCLSSAASSSPFPARSPSARALVRRCSWSLALGLLIYVVAYGLYQPAAYAGVRRYTNPQTAAMGYAVVYGLMNLGALLFGFRFAAGPPSIRGRASRPTDSPRCSGPTPVCAWSPLVITLTVLTRKTDAAAVERVAARQPSSPNSERATKGGGADTGRRRAGIAKTRNLPIHPLRVLAAAVAIGCRGRRRHRRPGGGSVRSRYVAAGCLAALAVFEFLRDRPDHPFRDGRFTFFIFVLIPVQTLFAHNWLTLPYYLDRAFRGSVVSEYFEFFSNINPILIFVLAPIVAGLTARANVYTMMIIGTLVMALPTFLLVLGPHWCPFSPTSC